MSRQKKLRPLSQTGWIRVPSNPRQRNNYPVPVPRTALAQRNENLAAEAMPRFLHATKGFRPLSAKQSKAEMLAAHIRAGMLPWSMKLIKRELREVSS